jgi:hypothetical protein
MKKAVLKGYLRNEPYLLLSEIISQDMTLELFQNARIQLIEKLKYEFDRFETEIVNA